MQTNIEQLTQAIQAYQGTAEDFKRTYTGRKGAIVQRFKTIQDLPEAEKKTMGQALNQLKALAHTKLQALQAANPTPKHPTSPIQDPTLPPLHATLGSLHPLRIIEQKIVTTFQAIGFTRAQGPDIEDDWHNFSALNFPQDHPARDMQDTFFLHRNKKWLLRTHTSNVQIRIMSTTPPPLRIVSSGRVFRNEAISARTHCIFHQVEAFYLDQHVTLAHLKSTLLHFVRALFGKQRTLRLRPSYFPFTQPSVEVDMDCPFCAQKGCNLCKHTGWVEILGAGMIDPNVLEACRLDPTQYSGFALGMGIERIAMLYYQIPDIRLFTQNDARFLRQFSTFH